MRVLVTRARIAAETTIRTLAALGHEVLLLPLSEADYQPLPVPAVLPGAIAVTSAQALRAFDQMPALPVALLAVPIFCVGQATADAANWLGFRSVIVGPGNGDGLAMRILQDGLPQGKGHLLYLAGSPRSPAFEMRLKSAGLLVQVVEVYRMCPVAYAERQFAAQVRIFAPDAVLFYSREAVTLFFTHTSPAMLPDGVRFLCLSAQIADAIPAGCGVVQIAARPDEAALLALLAG